MDDALSLLCCRRCGALLDLPSRSNQSVSCRLCNYAVPPDDLRQVTFRSECGPEEFLRKFNIEPMVKDVANEEKRRNATVDESCPKCGHPEMEFYTMQLRSADEGTTVFYECRSCGHKFSQNN